MTDIIDEAPQGAEVRGMRVAEAGETFYTASQWQLMWWKFRKHKAALVAIVILTLLYLLAIFADLFAPYSTVDRLNLGDLSSGEDPLPR